MVSWNGICRPYGGSPAHVAAAPFGVDRHQYLGVWEFAPLSRILSFGDAVFALSHDHSSRWAPCWVGLQRYLEDLRVLLDVRNVLWMTPRGLGAHSGRHDPDVVGMGGGRSTVAWG